VASSALEGKDQETLLRSMPPGWEADDPGTVLKPLDPARRPPDDPVTVFRPLSRTAEPAVRASPPTSPTDRASETAVAVPIRSVGLWLAALAFVLGMFVGAAPFLGARLLERLWP
jgi:hypothetical protein